MYVEDAEERIQETKKVAPGAEVLYPTLPSKKEIQMMRDKDKE